MKISFLIILYNKKIHESSTFSSLIELLGKRDNIYVLIHNNGPFSVRKEWEENVLNNINGCNIDLYEDLSNLPLSFIYNDFVKKNYLNYDRLVILDDDSLLNIDYLNRIFDDEFYDLELPKIIDFDDCKIYFPTIGNKIIEKKSEDLSHITSVIQSAGSGMIISENLVKMFFDKKIELFDNAFALYGVDASFFWRLTEFQLIISSTTCLKHKMAFRSNTSMARRRELYINDILLLRRYPNFTNFKKAILCLMYSIYLLEIKLFFYLIKIFFIGKHPRSR